MKKTTRLGLIAWIVALAMIGLVSTSASAAGVTRHEKHMVRSGVVYKNAQGTMSAPIVYKTKRATFRGVFKPNRFETNGSKVFAVGKVVGKKTTRSGHVTWGKRTGVHVALKNASGSWATTGGIGGAGATALPTAVSCDVLNLVLGPLDLNLLGLEIHLNKVVLDIIAVPGALLGDLLCAVSNLLSGGLLGTLVTDLLTRVTDILNQILGQLQLP